MKKYGEKYTLTKDDLDVISTYMDDDTREKVHDEMMYWHTVTPEKFLLEYIKYDPDFENLLEIEFSIEL